MAILIEITEERDSEGNLIKATVYAQEGTLVLQVPDDLAATATIDDIEAEAQLRL